LRPVLTVLTPMGMPLRYTTARCSDRLTTTASGPARLSPPQIHSPGLSCEGAVLAELDWRAPHTGTADIAVPHSNDSDSASRRRDIAWPISRSPISRSRGQPSLKRRFPAIGEWIEQELDLLSEIVADDQRRERTHACGACGGRDANAASAHVPRDTSRPADRSRGRAGAAAGLAGTAGAGNRASAGRCGAFAIRRRRGHPQAPGRCVAGQRTRGARARTASASPRRAVQ